MPDLFSRSTSFGSIAARVSAGMTFAWSTIRPLSAGKLSASATHPHNRVNSAPMTSTPAGDRRRAAACANIAALELHLRRLLRLLVGREDRHRLVGAEEGRR